MVVSLIEFHTIGVLQIIMLIYLSWRLTIDSRSVLRMLSRNDVGIAMTLTPADLHAAADSKAFSTQCSKYLRSKTKSLMYSSLASIKISGSSRMFGLGLWASVFKSSTYQATTGLWVRSLRTYFQPSVTTKHASGLEDLIRLASVCID